LQRDHGEAEQERDDRAQGAGDPAQQRTSIVGGAQEGQGESGPTSI
jgi:hypothetical protein